jgi:hypothetical protein
MEYFAEEGLRRYVINEMKVDQSHIRNAETGEVVTTPSRVGVQARNDDGLKENWEQRYWWELSWMLFTEKVRERAVQRDAMDTRLAAFRQVLKLRERFPDTVTVEEACEMAGIDPRSFGIEGDVFTGTED